jgi:hypothetical protein
MKICPGCTVFVTNAVAPIWEEVPHPVRRMRGNSVSMVSASVEFDVPTIDTAGHELVISKTGTNFVVLDVPLVTLFNFHPLHAFSRGLRAEAARALNHLVECGVDVLGHLGSVSADIEVSPRF